MIYNITDTPVFSGEDPPEGYRILVLNRTSHFVKGAWRVVEPVWREAYWWQGSWRLWCGKNGTTSTQACEFMWWMPAPKLTR